MNNLHLIVFLFVGYPPRHCFLPQFRDPQGTLDECRPPRWPLPPPAAASPPPRRPPPWRRHRVDGSGRWLVYCRWSRNKQNEENVRLLKGVNFKRENSHIGNGTVKYEILWVDSPAHPGISQSSSRFTIGPLPYIKPNATGGSWC